MLNDLKREAYEANLTLPRHGLVKLSLGNASAIDRTKGIFAIKPSGVSYDALRWSDMVLVDLKGRRVEGKLNPSADAPTHRRLYLAFKKIGGVVHTRSTFATAFAQAGRPIPIFGTTHADYFAGDIPVTRELADWQIEGAYEWETGNVIAERLFADNVDPLHYPGILVNRHGPFAWSATVAEAVEVAVAVECVAEMAMLSLQLNPKLSTIEPDLLNKHFQRKHGPNAYYSEMKK